MTFVKIHLKLDKANFKPSGSGLIVEEPCNYDRFMELLTRAGKPSNWNKRNEYHDEAQVAKLKDIFNQKSSMLWVYKLDRQDIGFCQVASVTNLSEIFTDTTGVMEMYKMGLFPEYIGKGVGKRYVSSVLREMFKENNTVYLNTRDTNKVNSLLFWQSLGFEVIKTEELQDDLLPE